MKHINLSGCGTALITPFRNGEVDYDGFASLVDRQVAAGIDVLVPLGTTGETPCLEDDERIKVLQIAREHGAGLPIVVGGGTNSLKHTIRSMEMLEPYGVDAFLIVVPYYNKPTQEGQYRYFKAVAESTDKPIVLYNVPGRTGVNMTAETALRLAEIDNIVATKEASGNREQIMEILRNAPEGFQVLSGNDDDTLWMMENGGAGIISVASNVAPELLASFVKAIREGRTEEAHAWNEKLTPLFTNCFVESNPIPAKAAMAAMGLIENELRLPLVPSQQSTYDLMVRTIRNLGLLG
ncbi:MAG: 4-hydroxy-tetrahydrodipicolinate synthase [Bacteroidales bacterium]|nr:4-hydroxy-tetrahydrodipicolinate synthase [Bacteroidales bacterium]MBR2856567.1 4-hydroxy-tetrahydrodipicolinate synthase [Bacteroidales bacterium]